jgi:hypothetical protein
LVIRSPAPQERLQPFCHVTQQERRSLDADQIRHVKARPAQPPDLNQRPDPVRTPAQVIQRPEQQDRVDRGVGQVQVAGKSSAFCMTRHDDTRAPARRHVNR